VTYTRTGKSKYTSWKKSSGPTIAQLKLEKRRAAVFAEVAARILANARIRDQDEVENGL
jgi:hypothetical protein